MKRHLLLFALLPSLTTISLGCGNKDEGADKPAADKPAADKPAATTSEPIAGDLPAECKAYMEAVELVSTCDQIPKPSQDSIIAGYKMNLKSMVKSGDAKGMIKGCLAGVQALATMRKSAGC